MQDEPAPAAADVEQTVAGLEPEFAANNVQLVALGRVEILIRLQKYARVHHAGIEPELVELGRHIVVIANGLGVAFLGMAGAGELGGLPALARLIAFRHR